MIAPSYEPEALEILSTKKNRRMLTLDPIEPRVDEVRLRQLDGGWLAQVQGLQALTGTKSSASPKNRPMTPK